jgi:hypothetical protein
MIDLETRLNLQTDAKAVARLLKQHGGRLVADDSDAGVYWLVMHPRSEPAETYIARVHWSRYPDAPPSVRFASEVGGDIDVLSAWPIVPGYRPTAFDICMPFTAEGFAVHPEWAQTQEAWRVTGNPFLWISETLQRDLNNRYQGRYQQ